MTIYLRNKDNETIVDIEITNKSNDKPIDLHSAVDLRLYSQLLLSLREGERAKCINTFEALQELRGWYWERWLEMEAPEDHTVRDVELAIMGILNPICEAYNLKVV